MLLAANIVVAIIALLHVYILVLEMFLWDKPAGLRAFGMRKELATATKDLGAATASRKILFIQTLPAVLALALLWAGA